MRSLHIPAQLLANFYVGKTVCCCNPQKDSEQCFRDPNNPHIFRFSTFLSIWGFCIAFAGLPLCVTNKHLIDVA